MERDSSDSEPAAEQQLTLRWDELGAAFDSFSEALDVGPSRCAEADRFRQKVCDLAEQICRISNDLPGSVAARSRCEDGRQRCAEASRRYRQRC